MASCRPTIGDWSACSRVDPQTGAAHLQAAGSLPYIYGCGCSTAFRQRAGLCPRERFEASGLARCTQQTAAARLTASAASEHPSHQQLMKGEYSVGSTCMGMGCKADLEQRFIRSKNFNGS